MNCNSMGFSVVFSDFSQFPTKTRFFVKISAQLDRYTKMRFSTSLKIVTFLYYFLMRNILSLYLSFYDKENRIWADSSPYNFKNLAKNAKKSPIFSRAWGVT